MTFVRARARILEISTTSGSGPLALNGAADGSYNTFASFMSVGDQTYVTVVEPGVAFWSGVATYSATNELTLTTVEETKGTFGAGTKEVMAGPLASTSMFREDIAGAIATGGSSTAYTVSSYRQYATLAQLNGNLIAFTPHATNGATVTLNVDGLGAKPLRPAPGVELQTGVLIQGTPYAALYNNSDQVFYLFGVGAAPGIPLGATIDYWGATAPSSHFVLAYGQAISRSVYAALFALFGTTYGAGDGSTTFNIPDIRGRVVAGLDPMGGSAAGRLTDAVSGFGDTLGEAGGSQSVTLIAGQIPTITSRNPAQSITVSTVSGGPILWQGAGSPAQVNASGGSYNLTSNPSISGNNDISVTSNNTGGNAHSNVQPTIVANKLLRVI
ncbi:MAG: tail fiber protein [Bradyrhizobium sp.]|uniref:phage tail protein n=1 Tax=Bradyrhizobium sp. TaxID=376 RepID=UPI0029B3804E|nr:tail fiber protein [Bradyrhizobium sp.]MDX3971179.1 tail fiber protein [Bradyrhizobium sp.]